MLSDVGVPAFTSYVATIRYGANFENVTVKTPSIVGYNAYLEDGDTVINSVVLNYANLTEDVVITVNYKPADVDYTVRYYFQNIYDDNYVETVEAVNAQGPTGSEPSRDIVQKEFEGFTTLYYIPETIAADGSTVFEVYYERNYYLMEFDCNGGYGTDTVYARYGSYVSVASPVRSGYIFSGWDLITTDDTTVDKLTLNDGVKDELPLTVPFYNTGYKAIWTTTDTTYTVVYWAENANDDGYSYWDSQEIPAKSADELKASEVGKAKLATDDSLPDFNYLSYSEEVTAAKNAISDTDSTEKTIVVEGDGSTVINVYYVRDKYTLKFYYAMSSGSGDSATYYVVGGSTWYFGTSSKLADSSSEKGLLDQYLSTEDYFKDPHSQIGKVTGLPTLNDKGLSRNYITGSESSTVSGTQYRYHYIAFTAKYGADISNLWPCDVFESVTRSEKNTHNWSGTEAFVSAWNGEHHVLYSQSYDINKGNQTIKGNYEKLDEKLLWDYDQFGAYADSTVNDIDNDGNPDNTEGTVAYLCFWENGANISWSVPELYRYNIYLEPYDGQDLSGKTTKVFNDKTYYLADSYDTCDDSDVSHQTAPALTGYHFDGRESSKITDFDTNLYSEANDVNFF